jgi:hypothetical protein
MRANASMRASLTGNSLGKKSTLFISFFRLFSATILKDELRYTGKSLSRK